jgi:hypothetical protein
VAAILTQVRGLRPELALESAEQLLVGTSAAKAAGPFLDVAAALNGAGAGDRLAVGRAATPGTAGSSSARNMAPSAAGLTPSAGGVSDSIPARSGTVDPSVLVSQQPAREKACSPVSKPRLRRWSLRHQVLTVAFKQKPKRLAARVDVYARRKGRAFPSIVRTAGVRADTLRIRVSGTVTQVSIIYLDPSGSRCSSALLRLEPR